MIRASSLPAAVCAALVCGAAAAGERDPRQAMLVSVAQQSVLENYLRRTHLHFSIAFDVSYVYPQSDADFWAVVGGFMAKDGTRYLRHKFVAAVRLLCEPFRKLDCWKVEKLAIDDTILFK